MRTILSSFAAALALTFFLFPASSLASNYYKWVDEDGTTHYGSTPPQKHEDTAEQVKTYTGRSENLPLQTVEEPVQQESTGGEKQAQQKAENQQKNKPEKPKKNKAACKQAKENLAKMRSTAIVRTKDKDGNLVVVDRAKKEKELQRIINKEC